MFVNALNSAPNLHSINFSIGEQGEGDEVDPIEVAKFLSGKLNKNLDLIITWTCGVFFIKERDKEQVLAVLLKETTSSLEITSSEEPASDEENQYLQIIYNDGVLRLEDFQSNIEDDNNFNTISIYRGIVSGLVEYDDDVKLDTSQYYHNLDIVHIKAEQEFDNWRLIDYAARHQHTLLIHELHRIGKIDLKARNSDDKTVLEIAVTYGTPEVIAALFGLSLPLPPSDDIYLSYDNKVFLDIELFDSRTVLMVAAADGKKENLDLLLRLGANFNKVHNQNKKTALDYALAQQHNDCVLSLLKSGAKFPKKWAPSIDNRLEEFYKECSTIATSLKKGELLKIESYLETKKLTVHFLSTDNHSAPYIAFLAKQYEIYAMLRSKGFALIEEEQIDIQLLSTQDRTLLQQHMISFSNKHAYSSINFLMSKSRILQPSNQHFKTIQHVYKMLSEIPEVLNILRVLEYSGKHFDILFDFEKDNVEEISASSSQNAAGSCAFKVGYVFIAGKTELCQLMGTTAHELTHQAIDMLYNNACNPFSSQEIDAIKPLTDIEEKSQGLAENDIIKRVFKCYKKEDWHAEIIVRVPHILATYDSDQGSKLLEIEAPGLRNFYEEYVTEKCKLFIHEVQKRGSKDLSFETTLDTSTGIPSITNTIFNILIQNHYISRKLINYVYQDELLAINTVIRKPYVKPSTIPNIQLVLQKHPLEWNYGDFKKIKLIVHPDKGGNSEDFLTVNVFQKQVGDKDQMYQSLLPKLLQTIQIMTYKANIGFKMLDTIVDSGRLVYEPTIQNAKKVILDSVYLYSMSSGVNGLVGAIIGSETLYQTYLGDYAQAFKTTVITIAYMALPKLLTYTAVPHLGLKYGCIHCL